MKKQFTILMLLILLVLTAKADLGSAVFGLSKDMSLTFISAENPVLGKAISFALCPQCAVTSEAFGAIGQVSPELAKAVQVGINPGAAIKSEIMGQAYQQLSPEEQKIFSNIEKYKPYVEEAFKENENAPEGQEKGTIEIDDEENTIIKDSYGNFFAKIPGGFEALESEEGFTLVNKNAKEDAVLEIKDFKINADKEAKISFYKGNDFTLISLESGSVNAAGTKINNVKNANIKLDNLKQVEFAEFTSTKKENYKFMYNNEEFAFKTEEGSSIKFDPKSKQLIGENINLKYKNQEIRASQISADWDENNFNEIKLSANGVYEDLDNKLKYSSKEDFNIYFDGRDVLKQRNAISIFKEGGRVKLNSKGRIRIKNGINYEGLNEEVYTTYRVWDSVFDVRYGDAKIDNGKHQVYFEDGSIYLSNENLVKEGEAKTFLFRYTKNKQADDPSYTIINEESGNLETISFKEGKETKSILYSFKDYEDKLIASAKEDPFEIIFQKGNNEIEIKQALYELIQNSQDGDIKDAAKLRLALLKISENDKTGRIDLEALSKSNNKEIANLAEKLVNKFKEVDEFGATINPLDEYVNSLNEQKLSYTNPLKLLSYTIPGELGTAILSKADYELASSNLATIKQETEEISSQINQMLVQNPDLDLNDLMMDILSERAASGKRMYNPELKFYYNYNNQLNDIKSDLATGKLTSEDAKERAENAYYSFLSDKSQSYNNIGFKLRSEQIDAAISEYVYSKTTPIKETANINLVRRSKPELWNDPSQIRVLISNVEDGVRYKESPYSQGFQMPIFQENKRIDITITKDDLSNLYKRLYEITPESSVHAVNQLANYENLNKKLSKEKQSLSLSEIIKESSDSLGLSKEEYSTYKESLYFKEANPDLLFKSENPELIKIVGGIQDRGKGSFTEFFNEYSSLVANTIPLTSPEFLASVADPYSSYLGLKESVDLAKQGIQKGAKSVSKLVTEGVFSQQSGTIAELQSKNPLKIFEEPEPVIFNLYSGNKFKLHSSPYSQEVKLQTRGNQLLGEIDTRVRFKHEDYDLRVDGIDVPKRGEVIKVKTESGYLSYEDFLGVDTFDPEVLRRVDLKRSFGIDKTFDELTSDERTEILLKISNVKGYSGYFSSLSKGERSAFTAHLHPLSSGDVNVYHTLPDELIKSMQDKPFNVDVGPAVFKEVRERTIPAVENSIEDFNLRINFLRQDIEDPFPSLISERKVDIIYALDKDNPQEIFKLSRKMDEDGLFKDLNFDPETGENLLNLEDIGKTKRRLEMLKNKISDCEDCFRNSINMKAIDEHRDYLKGKVYNDIIKSQESQKEFLRSLKEGSDAELYLSIIKERSVSNPSIFSREGGGDIAALLKQPVVQLPDGSKGSFMEIVYSHARTYLFLERIEIGDKELLYLHVAKAKALGGWDVDKRPLMDFINDIR